MKRCPGCEQSLPESKFARNKAKKDGLACHCRICKKKIQERWYARHKERHKKDVRERRAALKKRNKKKLFDFLCSNPCVDCGERRPFVLDFDHRGDKKAAISNLLDLYAWENVLPEIQKCDVRCSNCHRARHAKDGGWALYDLWVANSTENNP